MVCTESLQVLQLLMMLLLLLLMQFAVLLHGSKSEQQLRRQKSQEIQNYLNVSADPCDDFYAYACGNWLKYHNSSSDISAAATPITQLQAKIDGSLHYLLKEPVTVQNELIERHVKVFYKSCLQAEKNGPQQQEFLSKFIPENGGFPAVPGTNWLMTNPNYNWQEVVAALRYNYGMDILIGIDIDINYQNMEENSIYLTEPSMLIPRHMCSKTGTKTIDIRDLEYEHIEKEVAENLKNWLTLKLSEARQYAADIVTFEYDLCTAVRDPVSYANGTMYPTYERHTFSEYTNKYNNSIHFTRFITLSFGTPIYKPAFMAAPDYYRNLIKTMGEHNITTVANYIMYRALEMLNFPHSDTPARRPRYCLDLIKRHFPKVLGEMYKRGHANADALADVETIYRQLKQAFKQSLRSDWLEESTSRLGQQKLKELSLNFPRYERVQLNNFVMGDKNYWKNLEKVLNLQQSYTLERLFENGVPKPKHEIESYDIALQHRQPQNRIDLGWGLMQEPYYTPHYPMGVCYASIGQALAKTLATAFDELHWTADAKDISNWDQQTALEYANRSECFRQQLSNYLHNNPQQFQNADVVRDLIATSGGLNVAFNAYLQWLGMYDPYNNFEMLSLETLLALNFSNTQLFFVTFAQAQCRSVEGAWNGSRLVSPLMKRKLEYYLVNGPLRNSAEFAREFGCAIGTEMNPVDKCVIY